MLSPDEYKTLQFLYRQRKRLVPEDKLPAWITADRICDLESKGSSFAVLSVPREKNPSTRMVSAVSASHLRA